MKATVISLLLLVMSMVAGIFMFTGCEEEAAPAYNCIVKVNPTTLDFGNVDIEDTNSLTFTATLDCDEGGAQRDVVVKGESTALLVEPNKFNLAKGESQEVTVTLNYKNLGLFTHVLTLDTGSDDDEEITLEVSGTLHSQSYYLYKEPQVIEFGEIVIDSLVTHDIDIYNSTYASESCTLDISSTLEAVEFTPSSMILAPGEHDTITVSIANPTEILGAQGKIILKNPQDESVLYVEISGSILGFPQLEIIDPISAILDFGLLEPYIARFDSTFDDTGGVSDIDTIWDTADTLSLTFSNPGNGRLDQAKLEELPGTAVFSFTSTDDNYDPDNKSFALPFDEEIVIDLIMECAGDTTYHLMDLIIWSNEVDSLFVPVSGECVW